MSDLYEIPNRKLLALCTRLEREYLDENKELVAVGFGDHTDAMLRRAYATGATGDHSALVKRHLATGDFMARCFSEQIRRRDAGTLKP